MANPPDLTPRKVSESQSEMTELVLPNDTNPLHGLLGGRLMHWMDIAAAMAAHRHARHYVVTASVDHLDFVSSARVGNFVVLRSSINRAFHTSMEVGVKVWVEDYLQNTRTHVSSAYLTFVAVDKSGHPQPVPPVIPETPEEIRRYEGAGRRREHRLAERDIRRANRGSRA
jgi:acyl-CoA hydrolase